MVVLAHTEAVIAPGQSCQSPPASPLSSPSPPSCTPRCRRSCWLFGLHLLLPLPPTRGAVLPAAQSRLVTRTARCSRVPAALGYLPPAGVASPSRRARCGVVARRHPPPPPASPAPSPRPPLPPLLLLPKRRLRPLPSPADPRKPPAACVRVSCCTPPLAVSSAWFSLTTHFQTSLGLLVSACLRFAASPCPAQTSPADTPAADRRSRCCRVCSGRPPISLPLPSRHPRAPFAHAQN